MERPKETFEVDTTKAQPARVVDYLLGGTAHFAVDREVGDHLMQGLPGGREAFGATIGAMASFLEQVLRYMAEEAGVRQFLYGSAPGPAPNQVRDVAREIVPHAQSVYVTDDPVVTAHAHTQRTDGAEDTTHWVHCRMDDTATIVGQASATLDFSQPIAVILIGTLMLVPDPQAYVAEMLRAVPSGSYLAVTCTATDIEREAIAEWFRRLAAMGGKITATRDGFDRAGFTRLFEDLEMVGPGVAPLDQWHLGPTEPRPTTKQILPTYAALARKP
jgi:hypothetical protein